MIEYFTALVDRAHEWAPLVESRLRRTVRSTWPVLAFDRMQQLLDLMDEDPLRVPLVAIADTDALLPSPQEGVFGRLAPIRRCLFIYYSANPSPEAIQSLSLVAPYRIVSRVSEDPVQQLQRLIEAHILDLEQSSDWMLIRMYESYVSGVADADVSTLDSEDLSPMAMLREMIRGSTEGRKYLQDMIPLSWAPSAGERT